MYFSLHVIIQAKYIHFEKQREIKNNTRDNY